MSARESCRTATYRNLNNQCIWRNKKKNHKCLFNSIQSHIQSSLMFLLTNQQFSTILQNSTGNLDLSLVTFVMPLLSLNNSDILWQVTPYFRLMKIGILIEAKHCILYQLDDLLFVEFLMKDKTWHRNKAWYQMRQVSCH